MASGARGVRGVTVPAARAALAGAGDAGPARAGGAAGDLASLLLLAAARPHTALAQARAVLAAQPGAAQASVARQAIGLVLRDFGDTDTAITELRAALRHARATGSPGRQSDVLATLGATLIQHGQTRRGLAVLGSSLALVSGSAAGQVLVRRGINLWILGLHREALDDLRRAVRLLRPAHDPVWEGRALTARALVHLAAGSARRAELDLRRAADLFAMTSQDREVAHTWHNRALLAFRSGDLPRALACLDEADHRYQRLSLVMPELHIDRCAVLLAAGLATDALQEADAGVARFPAGGKPTTKAELLLSAARAALAAGQPDAAAARARLAHAMFAAQGRAWWRAHARLLLIQAVHAAGSPPGGLFRQAAQVAAALERLGSADATAAHLLAGRLGLAAGRHAAAGRHLALAARVRQRNSAALLRAQGWLAVALRRDAAGDRRGLLAACRRGLAVLGEHQLTLGASELRAQATAPGSELACLAQRAALDAGRPRQLLAWSERWRATGLLIPTARPAGDPAWQADLTALRDVTGRLNQASAAGTQPAALLREQRRLEVAVRARVLRTRGQHRDAGPGVDIPRLLAELGEGRLLQIVQLDGWLHLLVCGAGRVRHVPAGPADAAAREVDYARFGLRRLAHGPDTGLAGHALGVLEACGRRLDGLLLGAARRYLGDGPVVVVPPGALHAVPWALLPSLRDRPVSVAPSARAWLRAHTVPGPPPGGPVLVRGPGLGAGGGEVAALQARYPDATVLCSGAATVRQVLARLDGAPLAHIAAHGTFRADSPLFSALQLDDGPLTVHDLEGLSRAPYRMILPCCDSGVLAPAGADELLGLASALTPLGTAGLVASVGPVNDVATADLMLALHRRLARGASLAGALCQARQEVAGSPAQIATGWSFIALGAA